MSSFFWPSVKLPSCDPIVWDTALIMESHFALYTEEPLLGSPLLSNERTPGYLSGICTLH